MDGYGRVIFGVNLAVVTLSPIYLALFIFHGWCGVLWAGLECSNLAFFFLEVPIGASPRRFIICCILTFATSWDGLLLLLPWRESRPLLMLSSVLIFYLFVFCILSSHFP